MSLTDLLRARHQTLLQIFVPKDDIDDIGYLAWAGGIPADKKTIEWVRTNIKNRVFRGRAGKSSLFWAMKSLKDTFKKEQERNPLFREMLARAEEGDFSPNAFLKVYCNKPWELPDLNYIQARLLFTPDVLLNPESGVKIIRHIALDHHELEQYQKRFAEVVQKIVASGFQGVIVLNQLDVFTSGEAIV